MPTADINYLTVLIGALVPMGVGFLWYSMQGFGKPWMKEVGLSMKDIGKGPGMGYVYTMLGALLQSFVLAHFVDYARATNWLDGALTGFWIAVGFVATAIAANYIFAQRSLNLWLIDAGYFVVSLTLIGAVLGAMNSPVAL
jgi:hypothetical protein